ncbi:MAG: TlpA disulfide reductase family protein [Alcanivoracaceae bacterium]
MKLITTLLIAITLLGQAAVASELQGEAPDFTLPSLSGSNIKLSENRGDVVMVNFWASWCGPCRQEMPLLDELYSEYKDYGFVLLGVNVDEDSEKAKDLLEQVKVSFPVLLDPQGKVSALYDIDAMPSTVLIDRDGNQRYLHRGFKPGYEARYEEQVKALVLE